MIRGKLRNGFEISISDEAVDDFEILEALAAISRDDGDVGEIVFVYKRFLGAEQYDSLKEHMRNENGKISTSEMMDVLKEIFEISGETKNS